jgi:hypothetical protein
MVTWITISMPIMLLAIAIAVLPVLLMSISEARRNFQLPDDLEPARQTAAAMAAPTSSDTGGPAEKAA